MKAPKLKPVIVVGWPTIALLAHGKEVELHDVVLITDDLLFNTAAHIKYPTRKKRTKK